MSKRGFHSEEPEQPPKKSRWNETPADMPQHHDQPRHHQQQQHQAPPTHGGPVSSSFFVRLLIDSKNAGGIIGRKGAKITEIRQVSQARVEIQSTSPGVPKRVVTVTGSPDHVEVALGLIAQRVHEHLNPVGAEGDGGNIQFLTLLVPSNQIGAVLGKGGSVIKETRDASGCRVKVSTEEIGRSTEKTVDLDGAPTQLAAALKLMLYQLYDNRDQAYAEVQFDPEKEHALAVGMRPYMHPARMGPPPSEYSTYTPEYNPNPMMYPPQQQQQQPPPQQHRDAGPPTRGSESSIVIPVPGHAIGGLIGRGGRNIAHIRQTTGASVKVEDPQPSVPHRLVTITGQAASVNMALGMIQTNIAGAPVY